MPGGRGGVGAAVEELHRPVAHLAPGHDEVLGLAVVGGGGPEGGFQDLLEEPKGDRPIVELPDASPGVQELDEVRAQGPAAVARRAHTTSTMDSGTSFPWAATPRSRTSG